MSQRNHSGSRQSARESSAARSPAGRGASARWAPRRAPGALLTQHHPELQERHFQGDPWLSLILSSDLFQEMI